MSLQSSTPSPVSPLYQAWQALLSEQPRLRARDAAQRLSVSEAELTASRLGVDTVRLRPDWASLLPALGELGYIMALTRNEHCVHERKGYYREVSVAANGQMGLVVSADIDLRLFMGGWASVFAVAEETPRGIQRSIQIFDQQGMAVHKVFLTEDSELSAWDPLVERFRTVEQSDELDLRPQPEPVQARPDAEINVDSLRQGWATLKDTHHFFALLKRHGAERIQALRLAGSQWAEIAKTYTSRKPSQKVGIEKPDTANTMTPRSSHEPRRQAASTPMGTPITMLITMESRVSEMVASARWAMSVVTGRPE